MSETIHIADVIQTKYDFLEGYSLTRDIILVLAVYALYAYVPFETFSTFIRYWVAMIILRYLMSLITTLTKENGKKYFQISGHMSMFTLVLLVARDNDLIQKYAMYVLAVSYGILNSAVKAHYTSDLLATYTMVMYLYNAVFKTYL